ncbi:MAG: hypothetical protein U0172_08525 [Nitrospiraceae bacterium]
MICAALVGVVAGLDRSAVASSSVSDAQVARADGHVEAFVTVQIAGRFCRYQRAEVKAALDEVWSVDAVEFLNDQGTIRVFFDRTRKPPVAVAGELEHALSLGLLCTAHVHPSESELPSPATLLQVRR